MFKDNTYLLIFLTIVLIYILHKKLIQNMDAYDYSIYIVEDPTTEVEVVSPNPGDFADCYKNPNDKSTKAWTNKDSTQYPVNHSSGLTNDITPIFFLSQSIQ